MKEIYLDNSATTRAFPEVTELSMKLYDSFYGNASSMHRKGFEAEQYIREAKDRIAGTLKVKPKEIIFTSGGTESDNTAVFGTVLARGKRGRHIITTRIEHPAILKPLEMLSEHSFEITYLPVDERGHVDPEMLEKAVREDTVLVSIMHVNNETGAVQDIKGLSGIVKEKNPNVWFHTDAVQSYGKYIIRPKSMGIDMLSVSGHKIHGPKGTGFLYVDEKVKLKPFMYGGGQQDNQRSGTLNTPGIGGLGLAGLMMYSNFTERHQRTIDFKDRLISGLQELDGVHLNSFRGEESAPHIVSASFEGIRSEVLLHQLEERGIMVSAGSACSSSHPGLSGTLSAIGLKKDLIEGTLRFSLGEFNTDEDIDSLLSALREDLPKLRKYRRR